jgi:hypothetical protein
LIFHIDANPVLVLSLSAYMTEYQIDEHGDFVRPFYSGNELLSHPVRRWRNGRIAISPEVAVERVWRATGTRVTRVPERVWTGDPNEHMLYFGIYSLWKLTLERPVLMKADDTGAEVLSSEIFVDGKGRFLIAQREQPTSFRIAAYRLTAEFDVPPEPVELPIRSELPVRLTVANPVNNSGAVR